MRHLRSKAESELEQKALLERKIELEKKALRQKERQRKEEEQLKVVIHDEYEKIYLMRAKELEEYARLSRILVKFNKISNDVISVQSWENSRAKVLESKHIDNKVYYKNTKAKPPLDRTGTITNLNTLADRFQAQTQADQRAADPNPQMLHKYADEDNQAFEKRWLEVLL